MFGVYLLTLIDQRKSCGSRIIVVALFLRDGGGLKTKERGLFSL